MPAPVITYPDAQHATRDALRARLAAENVAADVSTRDPDHDDAHARTRPHIRVRTTSTSRSSASASARVGLSVYDVDEGACRARAALVEGLLLAETTTDDLRGFSPSSGPVPGVDPATGIPRADVELIAHLRPRQR